MANQLTDWPLIYRKDYPTQHDRNSKITRNHKLNSFYRNSNNIRSNKQEFTSQKNHQQPQNIYISHIYNYFHTNNNDISCKEIN